MIGAFATKVIDSCKFSYRHEVHGFQDFLSPSNGSNTQNLNYQTIIVCKLYQRTRRFETLWLLPISNINFARQKLSAIKGSTYESGFCPFVLFPIVLKIHLQVKAFKISMNLVIRPPKYLDGECSKRPSAKNNLGVLSENNSRVPCRPTGVIIDE